MMTATHIRELYTRYGADADVCITEGVMGLFDGARKSQGSSAELAIKLGLPVILVLNAKAMAYSAAALLYGLKNFDPRVRIAGVIFNFVDSPSHYRILQEACADVGVTALGHLPANKSLSIPSRHLGLDTAQAGPAIAAAAEHIAKHIDLPALLTATAAPAAQSPTVPMHTVPVPNIAATKPSSESARPMPTRPIFVARDAAFHFLYPENLRRLEEIGHIHYFSPLDDPHLPAARQIAPENAPLLYLPGGYPELYLEKLSENCSMLQDIRTFAKTGGQLIAECGGMMYLGKTIADENGKAWPMTGLLDIETSMAVKKLSLGYRTVELAGHTLKGHEFHYSQLMSPEANADRPQNPALREQHATAQITAKTTNVHNQPVETAIFHRPGLLASYMHFYWGEDPALLSLL